MAPWKMRTKRDELEAEGGDVHALQRCECGRLVAADMLVCLAGLPAPMRAALGLEGRTHLCDACRYRLHAGGIMSRADFAIAMGAPESVREHPRARKA